VHDPLRGDGAREIREGLLANAVAAGDGRLQTIEPDLALVLADSTDDAALALLSRASDCVRVRASWGHDGKDRANARKRSASRARAAS